MAVLSQPVETGDAFSKIELWMTFPLPKLPKKLILKVLEQMNCVDLIDFSQCSKKCCRLVQETRHGIDGIELSVMANNTMIMLKSGMEPRGFIDFESTMPDQPVMVRLINKRYFSVIKIDCIYYCRNYVTNTLPIRPISNTLTYLFKAPLHITIIPNGFDMKTVLKDIKKCDALTISGASFITPDDLNFLMTNLKPDKYFNLNVRHNGIFHPPEDPEFADVDHLEMMGTAEWVTRALFLRLSCKRIRLSFCHLKAQDFEHFVLQWQKSNNTTFEYLEVWHKVSPGIMSFCNSNLRTWDSFRRAQFYNCTPFMYIDCSKGYDIVRNDGMIATVVCNTGSFHFIVWKDPFPSITGNFLPLC